MSEEQLHKHICEYIKMQYPRVIFNTDMSGISLTMGQAMKVPKLRSSNGFPDIVIYEQNKEFNALFLEIKAKSPYQQNGEFYSMKRYEVVNGIKVSYDHLQQQNNMHIELRKRGYKAEFVWTFEQAKDMIDTYLKL